MEKAVIGFSVHTGWAAAVCLAGPPGSPTVVDRRRLDLLEPALPRQAYHAARRLLASEAEELVRRAIEAAEARARRVVYAVVDDLRSGGHELMGSGIILGGRARATLRETLSTHAATHAAEGEMFRNALIHASDACGLPVIGAHERDLYGQAASSLNMAAGELRGRVAELGRPLGPPWARDQKSAALVAWLALARISPAVRGGQRVGRR